MKDKICFSRILFTVPPCTLAPCIASQQMPEGRAGLGIEAWPNAQKEQHL